MTEYERVVMTLDNLASQPGLDVNAFKMKNFGDYWVIAIKGSMQENHMITVELQVKGRGSDFLTAAKDALQKWKIATAGVPGLRGKILEHVADYRERRKELEP